MVPENIPNTLPVVEEEESDCDSDDEKTDDDPLKRAVKRAVNIVREGAPRALSRAARALLQSPLAPIDDETIAQLRSLHPVATESLQSLPRNKAVDLVAVDPSTLFRLLKLRVNNGSAPGPSGWTGSHLMLLVESGTEEAKTGLTLLTKDICNGVFGGSTQQRLLASVLMPISKNGGKGIRPIAMGEVFVKLAAHYSMSLIESQLPSLFPRIQFGVKRAGGSESAAQLTRAVTDRLSITCLFSCVFPTRLSLLSLLPLNPRIYFLFHHLPVFSLFLANALLVPLCALCQQGQSLSIPCVRMHSAYCLCMSLLSSIPFVSLSPCVRCVNKPQVVPSQSRHTVTS